MVGGPAIIFHRYHEKDVTKIRGEETCRSIVGHDANALSLWALMQDMPTGWYMRRRAENGFRPQQAQPYGQIAVQWLIGNRTERDTASVIRSTDGRIELANFRSTGGVQRRILHISFMAVISMVVRNATTKMK